MMLEKSQNGLISLTKEMKEIESGIGMMQLHRNNKPRHLSVGIVEGGEIEIVASK